MMLSVIACKDDDAFSETITFESADQAVITEIENLLGFPVSLQIDTRREIKPWIFLTGLPLNKDGSRIDYSKTRFADDLRQGFFDDNFLALVKSSDNGSNWSLTAFSLGATDAPFVDWPDSYGAPSGLFFKNRH